MAIDLFAGAPLLAEIGYFFSKLAVVTFGGAYAVLAYMAQDVIAQLGWLQSPFFRECESVVIGVEHSIAVVHATEHFAK